MTGITELLQAPQDAECASQRPQPFRISRRDLISLIINWAFALLGLALLPSAPDVGLVTLALFGSGALFLGWQQWRRYTEHRLLLTSVAVAGGVPIAQRRGSTVVKGLWLVALGLVFVVFGGSYPVAFQWLGGFVFLVGIAVTALAALRLHPAGFLQFEPDGLIIAQRSWQVLVPWDRIYAVKRGDISNTPFIRLGVTDIATLAITPPSATAKALQEMLSGSRWSWGPFMIFPTHYGIATPVLGGAIVHYVRNAPARKNLSHRQLNAPASSP